MRRGQFTRPQADRIRQDILWAQGQATATYMAATTTLDQIPIATNTVNFNNQQAANFRLENRTSDPGSPATGRIWLRTDL
jgi:hypothetical protein